METFTQSSWLYPRAQNRTGRTGRLGMEALGRGASTSGLSNSTKEIFDSLVLDKVIQVRFMHIAVGCISITLVCYIILRIWYDSWRASKLSVSIRQRKFAFLWNLHPAESFPLLLGFFILIQQISFVAIQSRALKDVFVPQCRASSQIVFTQIFVVGFVHFVFGLEMTIRSLRRFAPRPKYTSPVCIAIVFIMCVLTWLSTRIRMPRNRCFGDMIWRSIRSAPLGVVICIVLIPSFLVMAAIIALQLHRTINIEPNERIACTRMVYYLLLSAILYIMILPFWAQAVLSTFDSDLSSSRVAEFVLFLSGAVIAFTHMFLRANAARTAIKPSDTPWHERRGFRLFGPSDLELMHISAPIMKQEYRPDEKVADVWASKEASMSASDSDFIFPATPPKAATKISQWPLPSEPIPPPKDRPSGSSKATASPPKAASHRRNQASYSLFPGSEDLRLPATVYTPSSQPKAVHTNAFNFTNPFSGMSASPDVEASGGLQPPVAPWKAGHRRGSSADSMATVQIGIRFSTAPAALAASGIRSPSAQPTPPSLRGVIDSISSESTLRPSNGPTSSRLEGPFDPNIPSKARQSGTSDYAWLDIAESPSRQGSQRLPSKATAESNRNEIAHLERTGSMRSRPGYQSPPTPDNASKNTGFF